MFDNPRLRHWVWVFGLIFVMGALLVGYEAWLSGRQVAVAGPLSTAPPATLPATAPVVPGVGSGTPSATAPAATGSATASRTATPSASATTKKP